jgi:hypothetical protein
MHAQIAVLILIQIMEIIRFIIVRPFKTKIRNFIRFGLDFTLLLFFGTVLIQGFLMLTIMSADTSTLLSTVDLFYKVGWTGFALAFTFNIGHLTIIIYDTVIGCRKSNRYYMDEARKIFYMQKLNSYEEENEDVPLSLINKWVKLGNLNDRKYD